MKKVKFLYLSFLSFATFTACDCLESPEEEKPIIEVDHQDGFTAITKDGLTIKTLPELASGITYDNARKEFLILNNVDQAEYWVSGTSNSRIRFSPSCKESAILILNSANITTSSGSSPVLWESDLKKLELKVQKGTENYLTATRDDVSAVESINNLDIGGGGVLNLSSKNASCINCDNFTLKGTGVFNVNSDGKHGIKCKSFDVKERTTFTCNISATKCGIKADGNVQNGKGYVNILSGTIKINSYGEYGIYATSNLKIGGDDSYAFVSITSLDVSTALKIDGSKTKGNSESSLKINDKEEKF